MELELSSVFNAGRNNCLLVALYCLSVKHIITGPKSWELHRYIYENWSVKTDKSNRTMKTKAQVMPFSSEETSRQMFKMYCAEALEYSHLSRPLSVMLVGHAWNGYQACRELCTILTNWHKPSAWLFWFLEHPTCSGTSILHFLRSLYTNFYRGWFRQYSYQL